MMIEISNLQKSYEDNVVLKDINISIKSGEIYGLVGRSGAGKSTLLRCINGLEKYREGNLIVNDVEVKELRSKDLRAFRKNMGMIFQHFSLMERKTVYQNIALPMECWGFSRDKIDKRVKELIQIIDLEDKLYDRPASLSGGQKQRVAIARALSLDPEILLCDEITSALDPKTEQSILQLLRKINEELNKTIILVTHQMSVVKEVCHKICILDSGEIRSDGDVKDIFIDEPDALKNLLGNEEVPLPKTGVNIRIVYTDDNVNDRVISDLSHKMNVGFSLIWGKTERYRDTLLGVAVINIDEEDLPIVNSYINNLNLKWEMIKDEQN